MLICPLLQGSQATSQKSREKRHSPPVEERERVEIKKKFQVENKQKEMGNMQKAKFQWVSTNGVIIKNYESFNLRGEKGFKSFKNSL